METIEKKSKNVIYFDLVDNINTSVVSAADIYGFIIESARINGLNVGSIYTQRKGILAEFEKIIAGKLEKISGGKSGKKEEILYSFKLTKGRELESLKVIKGIIKSYLSFKGRSVAKIDKKATKEMTTPSDIIPEMENAKVAKKERKRRSFGEYDKMRIERLFKIITHMIKTGKKSISYQECSRLTKSPVHSQYVTSWQNVLDGFKIGGVKLVSVSADSCTKELSFEGMGLTDLRIVLDRVYKEHTGKTLIKEEEKKQTVARIAADSEITSPQPKENLIPVVEFNPTDKYAVFAIGGIINNFGKAVSVVEIGKILRENFAIKLGKVEIEELVKKEPELEMVSFCSLVNLKTKGSWEILKQKYDPKQITRSVLVRLGIGLEELKKHFPESVLVSAITETDGIYKINYDGSRRSWRNLVSLYRTFRGTDKVLDEELENRLALEVASEVILIMKHDFAASIED